MKFEDKNEFQGMTHYPVCNESVRRWREVLKDVSVKVGAGIAGGGEISLFSVLPSVTEKLVLVDHSYVSLWALIGKYKSIGKLGPEKALKLLQSPPVVTKGGGYNINGQRVKGGQYNQYGEFIDSNPYSHKLVKPQEELYACFLEANKGIATETDRMEECGWWPLPELHHRWQEITVEDLETLLKNENDVDLQVYHGDISDLVEHAPVDLLYLSNALQYNGRNGKEFKLGEIVQKGSLVAYTGNSGVYNKAGMPYTLSGLKVKPVEAVKPIKATSAATQPNILAAPYSNYDGSWTYYLAEVL